MPSCEGGGKLPAGQLSDGELPGQRTAGRPNTRFHPPSWEGSEQSTSGLPIAGTIPGSAGGRPEQSSLFSTLLEDSPFGHLLDIEDIVQLLLVQEALFQDNLADGASGGERLFGHYSALVVADPGI